MQGVITRTQVLAHPVVIVESFGLRVLLRSLLAGAHETFLDVVSRCAEEEAHRDMQELDLLRTITHYAGYERRARELYRGLARQLAEAPDAAHFLATLALHEEGHAIVLERVRREVRRGRLWKPSRELHFEGERALEAQLVGFEDEVRRGGVAILRALEIVEAFEGSEINVVFDALSGAVDMRSRARFESFFVLTRAHLAYCKDQIARLRAAHPAQRPAPGPL